MNYAAAYRLEIHCTESGKWYSQVHDSDHDDCVLWESRLYESMEDAYDMGKYEWNARAEQDREAAVAARLAIDDPDPDYSRKEDHFQAGKYLDK